MSFIGLYPLYSVPRGYRGPPTQDWLDLPLDVALEMGLRANVYATRGFGEMKYEIVNDIAIHRFRNNFHLLLELAKSKASLVHGQIPVWIYTPLVLAPLFKRPYIITPHAEKATRLHEKAKPSSMKDRMALRLICKSDKILVQTHFTESSFSPFVDKGKLEVLPLPIDYKFWSATKGGEEFRSKTNIDGELIVTAAYLRPTKNIETLIHALRLVKQSFPNAKCAVVGPEAETNYVLRLKKLALDLKLKEDVIFTGALRLDDFIKVFDAADVFALPSRWECQSIVAYEAAATGLPLVLSNLEVLTEVFEGCALFHDPMDYASLAKRIVNILNDKKLAESLSKTGKAKMQMYDVSVFKSRLRNIYENVLQANIG